MEILHLEDDHPLREIMQIALTAADPDIIISQFEDSDSALDYIESHIAQISLFVLDVRVHGEVDGVGLAEKIRELKSTAPILITSAYGMPDESHLEELHCLWMPKPWHMMDAPRTILDLARGEIKHIPAQASRTSRLPSTEEMRRILAEGDDNDDTEVMGTLYEAPIPFDEELALPSVIEQTDMMVAISHREKGDIYRSQDAPVVEPYSEDQEV